MTVKDLARFRAEKEGLGPEKFHLKPLSPKRTGEHGLIVSFDQTLSSTGWALIRDTGKIWKTGMIRPTSTATGNQATLEKGDDLFEQVRHLLHEELPLVDYVVHETPPVSKPGAKMSRPESSLVAANAIRNAAKVVCEYPVVMIGAQTSKKRFTGNPHADKSLVHIALSALDPDFEQEHRPMNEHVRDAIANGWVALEKGAP